MDTIDRHIAEHWSAIFRNICIGLAMIAFIILVAWLMLSEPKTKLYEADNVVCVQSPLGSADCWKR